MLVPKDRYQSYLIRFQRHGRQQSWRVTIEEASTNQVYQFPNEIEAFIFLMQQIAAQKSDSEGKHRLL